ncbi:MAG: hypothetical protein M0P70_14070 [Desulfobulbaceae bacterium]|nr:hypothetical protein [Desulfobulbaceae bacterium]
MPKIKIFTAKNVQQYGFTAREIEALNAEWELKAAGLGLEEHLPEYWQEAKRHMNEKLAGRVAESPAEGESQQLDGAPVELPSLDVSLDDFDMGEEEEITAVDLPDEEFEVEFLSDEFSELEPIAGDELALEIIPEEQPVALAEMAEEAAALEGLEWEEEEAAAELTITVEELIQEEEPAEEPAIAQEPEPQEEAASEQGIGVAEMAGEEEPALEQPATAAETQLELEEVVYGQTVAVEEKAEEEKPAEEPAAAQEPEPQEEAAPEQGIAVAAMAEKIAEEKIVSAAEPEFAPADTVGLPETAVEELAQEEVAEEELAPIAERKRESFFEKMMARLKKIFQG